jgi:hypothetical protein
MKSPLIFAVLLMVGCANAPIHVNKMGSAEMTAVPTDKLMMTAFHPWTRNPLVVDELEKRGVLNALEAACVKNRRLEPGMREWVMLKIAGTPRRVNETRSIYGNRKQFVFGEYPSWISYVYTEKGIVTTIQE